MSMKVAWLIVLIRLAYWLNLIHREPPEEKQDSSLKHGKRHCGEPRDRPHRNRHHRDGSIHRTSDSSSHSHEEGIRHKVSYRHNPIVYRVDEQGHRRHGLNNDRPRKCHKKRHE